MRKINLTIPTPCHENWDKMTEVEKGKFCGSCQKAVVDFTSMSDRQLAQFFKKPTGSVCGRFHQDQLERDIVIPKKRIPWIKYFFHFTWPAFVLFLKSCGSKDYSVGQVKTVNENTLIGDTVLTTMGVPLPEITPVDTVFVAGGMPPSFDKPASRSHGEVKESPSVGTVAITVVHQPDLAVNLKTPSDVGISCTFGGEEVALTEPVSAKKEITGRVVDEFGKGIAHASVVIKGTNNGALTDTSGTFKISSHQSVGTLIVSALGYQQKEVKSAPGKEIVLQMETALMGEVIVVGAIVRKPAKAIPVIQDIIETPFSNFSVFPNPVSSGSSFNIQLKKFEVGRTVISLINNAGETIQSAEIVISNKSQQLKFTLKAISAGMYFVNLTNQTTGKTYTERIVVQ